MPLKFIRIGSALFQLRNLILLSAFVTFFALIQPIYSQSNPILSVTGIAIPTYPGGETSYQLQLLNHTDQIVYDGVLSITLPAGFTYVPNSTQVSGEGWPLENQEPIITGQTLTWGPYHLPAAGIQVHNPYGIHTLMNDCAEPPALHLEGAKQLVGNGGYVTQLFYGIDTSTPGPGNCAVSYVNEAYARNLIPILRLQGHSVNGVWQAPDPGPNGDYAEIAQAFSRYVSGLPRRDTNPLYIAVWNEPDLWIEWSGAPNASQYARFFVAVSTAIKQLGDGRIRVINGALTPGNNTFLAQMLAVPGFKEAFDVWASHCYPYNHPPSYNIHNRTARYGTYTIDCYLEETALIQRYGRTGFKVMLTETGYELGNQTFGFEGFNRINENNRASYISSAFAHFWQNWPEIVAVTPFQLTDTSGHWVNFDWLYPTPPYVKRPQFTAVAALAKPGGGLKPYGFQITFKAKVGTEIAPGTYFSQLRGWESTGNTAFADQAAPVLVMSAGPLQLTYLPIIKAPRRYDGPWYFSRPQAPSPGAIVPTAFLKPPPPPSQKIAPQTASPQVFTLTLAGEPQAMTLDESAGLGVVILASGHLELIDLVKRQSKGTVFVADNLQAITMGSPGSNQAYLSSAEGLIQLDLQSGVVINRVTGLGRLQGLAWDTATHRLFVAKTDDAQLLAFKANLGQQPVNLPLNEQPDQLIIDSATRHLYVSCPAARQVLAINADTLAITGQATLAGGPIIDLAFDASRNRLYALNILAPGYRGITIWQAPHLESLATVAGSGKFLLQTASALALTSGGKLLATESSGIWQITPDGFEVRPLVSTRNLTPRDGLLVQQDNETVYVLDMLAHQLRVYQ